VNDGHQCSSDAVEAPTSRAGGGSADVANQGRLWLGWAGSQRWNWRAAWWHRWLRRDEVLAGTSMQASRAPMLDLV
jgi:hypothetical protein